MPSDGSLRYHVATTPAALKVLAGTLERQTIFGVDLEADSMYHFREKVCLLQLATPHEIVVVDTIAITDLSALRPVFRNPLIRKVFHGADYDVRSLYRDFNIRINNLFDTQLACRFLGYNETSLEAVVKKLFGVALDKKYQRKDWSRRPLPEEMLAYAATDVWYLVPLALKLEADLIGKERLGWVAEECRILSKVRPPAGNGGASFLNCKGAGRLSPGSLGVLEELLKLRWQIAHAKDRPLFKVFSHDALLALAEAKPNSLDKLGRTGALSPLQLDRYGRDILAAVKRARQLPEAQLPRYPYQKPKTVPAAVSLRLRSLKRWREAHARRLEIEPSLICSKVAMYAIAERNPSNPEDLAEIAELRQWQRKAFGKHITAAMHKKR